MRARRSLNGLESVRKSSEISSENKGLILRFYENCIVEGLSASRIMKYFGTLSIPSQWIDKGFSKATKSDIKQVVGRTEQSSYSDWSKHDFKVILKRFYRWLKGNDEVYPEEVRWIRTAMKNGCPQRSQRNALPARSEMHATCA